MTERDPELEALLEPLRKENASDFELKKWEMALREFEATQIKETKKKRMMEWGSFVQLAAAALLGFVLGANYFSKPKDEKEAGQSVPTAQVVQVETNENSDPGAATIEYISVKSE